MVEHLSEIVAEGHLDAEYITVESEHSAMSACVGLSATGCRTFTATSSQGLALMHEILFIVSAMRLPIVMATVNRALSAPINIWGDLSDVMANRDIGWVQLFGNNGQEVYDLTPCCFKIAEDRRVLLPVMLNIDGFTLSHVVEPIETLTQQDFDDFLPPYEPAQRLDVNQPISMGPVGPPDIFTETKKVHDDALVASRIVVNEVLDDFGRRFGRSYRAVEEYQTDDADVLLFTIGGTLGETGHTAVDALRARGMKIGQVLLRLWRPFPFDDIRRIFTGRKAVIVYDRALSVGGPGGPVASELRAAMYGRPDAPAILSLIAALGGRDVRAVEMAEQIENAVRRAGEGEYPAYEMVGVRE
ncbi:MAG: pyruvate ferredoxin oxidoreductase [Deltaproteobacteria bacterium]|nr:pyruvate ferredoxin oxidoreductase [Deltaproteobacteria bacterium]